MMFGAITRKLRDSPESGSYSLWKKLHASARLITLVLPDPVAILITYRRQLSSNIPADTALLLSKRIRSYLSFAPTTSYRYTIVSIASRWAK